MLEIYFITFSVTHSHLNFGAKRLLLSNYAPDFNNPSDSYEYDRSLNKHWSVTNIFIF